MPLDSSQIMAMNAQFQGQAMNQMAYANQIGMGGGYSGQQGGGGYGDRVMGGMMNSAAAIGGPMASAMGTLAPMGISAGLGLGAIGSTGVGIPIAAGMALGQYAGSQMYTGAQQQQALNQGLRSSFTFQNQYGGSGFSRSDQSQIGGMMRSLSEQVGPGGQITGMNELSSLASKMGSMGLAQGVKDVAEFGKRFKETLTALKSMAKDLGSTLEGAMEFAQSAKGSGIFGSSKMAQFTSMARGTAVAGGLALSEVTSAANIGSQISRSIGGLGRQGAVGGMKTIGQIGTAQQMGILSEEDIYNVTGLSGAEGRQAYAASSMQKSASFLKSGRGRRLLASMADKDGNLDPTGAMMLAGGGMGVSQTMQMDQKRLGAVGRANFIRNEGRLRGAALEEFGGFIPAMQMSQWASSRGIDLNNMDDRSMLFAQRQLGMGRDEVDQAVKMAHAMPRILQEMNQRKQKDEFSQDQAQLRKGMGVEGIKNRLEQAKHTVNSKLQKVGQDFFNEGSDMVDSFFRKLTGDYEQVFSEKAVAAYKNSSQVGSGSITAKNEYARYMGGGGGGIPLRGGGGSGGIGAFNRGGDLTGSALNPINGSKYLFQGESDASKFKRAGYEVTAKDEAGLAQQLGQFQAIARAANEMPSAKYLAIGAESPEWIRNGMMNGSIGGTGSQRLDSFGKTLMDKGTDAQKKAWEDAKGNPAEQARIMNSMAQGAGLSGQGSAMAVPKVSSHLFGAGVTESERREALAREFSGKQGASSRDIAAGAIGGLIGAGVGAIFTMGAGTIPGAVLGAKLGERLFGDSDKRRALGAFLESEKASNLVYDLSRTDDAHKRDREAAMVSAQDRVQVLRQKKSLTPDEEAEMQGMQGLVAASQYDMLLQAAGGDASKIPEDKLKKLQGDMGMSIDDIKKAHGVSKLISEGNKEAAIKGTAMMVGAEAEKRVKSLQKSGMASFEPGKNQLSLKAVQKMGAGAGIAQGLLEATALENEAGIAAASGDIKGAEQKLNQAQQMRAGQTNQTEKMSVAEQRKFAMGLSSIGMGEDAQGELFKASQKERLGKLNKKGGGASAVSQMLGLDVSADVLKGMKDMSNEDKAKLLAQQGGLKSDSEADIKKALDALGKGGAGVGAAASALQGVAGSQDYKDAQKKKKEEADAEDPSKQMVKSIEKGNDLLKLIAKSTGATVDEINKLDKKDPEIPK